MQPGTDNSTVGRETYSKILPAVVDAFNNSNIIAMRVFNSPKRWVGKYVEQVIQTSNSTTGSSFSGMDTFDTSDQENEQSLRWYVKGYYQSIVVPGFDYALNETPAQAISYLGQKMDKAKNSMTNGLGTLVYGLGLGKDIDGLGKIIDDSTSTSSYGELARATWGSNINASVTAVSGGVLTLDVMRAADNAAKAAGSTTESPTNIITTKDGFSFYEELLTPTLNSNTNAQMSYGKITANTPIGGVERGQGLGASSGYNTLDFRGLTVVADDKCTSGLMFFVNENYLEFQSLNHPKLKTISMKNQVTEGVYKEKSVTNTAFQYKEMQMPENQLAEIGQIILMGQLIHRNPRRNAKLTGITSA
jgi:hypothetical protein